MMSILSILSDFHLPLVSRSFPSYMICSYLILSHLILYVLASLQALPASRGGFLLLGSLQAQYVESKSTSVGVEFYLL